MNSGQLQVRFSQIDEEMRQIRGLIEQTQFQNKQIATDLKKLSDDVDYRLRAIEQKQAQAQAEPVASPPAAGAAETPSTASEGAPSTADAAKPATYKPESKEKPAEKPALTGKDFPDANAHYTYAFKLLNEKKFSEGLPFASKFLLKVQGPLTKKPAIAGGLFVTVSLRTISSRLPLPRGGSGSSCFRRCR
jgi:TolA-binding protein